jgi:hypothetical protein
MAVLEAVTIADALEPQSNETTVTTLKWLALAVELVTLLTLLKLWSKAVARVTLLCRFGHMAQVLVYSHPVLSHVVPNDAVAPFEAETLLNRQKMVAPLRTQARVRLL